VCPQARPLCLHRWAATSGHYASTFKLKAISIGRHFDNNHGIVLGTLRALKGARAADPARRGDRCGRHRLRGRSVLAAPLSTTAGTHVSKVVGVDPQDLEIRERSCLLSSARRRLLGTKDKPYSWGLSMLCAGLPTDSGLPIPRWGQLALGVDINPSLAYNVRHRGPIPLVESKGFLQGKLMRGFHPGEPGHYPRRFFDHTCPAGAPGLCC